mmetsp:Transcript_692/g.1263  ORF Transcript_692/g.1263 Transcript_692/m.1263 type:complete len:528 (-) Transcript_692:8051-9634(-)
MAIRSVLIKNRMNALSGHELTDAPIQRKSRFSIAELRGPIQFESISESSSVKSSEESADELGLESDKDDDEVVRIDSQLNRKKEHEVRKQALKDKKFEHVEKLRLHLRFIDTITAIVGLGGTTLAFIENESYYDDTNSSRNESTWTGNIIRIVVSISTLFLLLLVGYRTMIAYNLNREKKVGAASVVRPFLETWYFKAMWIEIIINAVHWPAFIDGEHEFYQLNGKLVVSNNAIFTTCTLARFYLALRLFEHYTKWSNRRSEMICEESGCEADTMFALKAVLKDRPLLILGFFISTTILICGVAARQFERPFADYNALKSQDYDYIWNCMWMIVLAMTTVGYGDFYPRTHMGRIFVVVAVMCGVFLISLIVVTMTISSQFTSSEAKAYSLLDRLNAKDASKAEAAQSVKYALMVNVIQRQRKTTELNDRELAQKKHLMTQHLAAFKREQNKSLHSDLTDEEMLRQLTEKINLDMEEISQHIKVAKDLTSQVEKIEKCQKATVECLVHCWKNSHDLLLKVEEDLVNKI